MIVNSIRHKIYTDDKKARYKTELKHKMGKPRTYIPYLH